MTTSNLKLKPAVFCSIVLLSLQSCEKKTIEGPQGEAGAPGKAATVTTTTLNIPSSAWSPDSDTLVWSALVFNSLLTKEVVDKGVVKLSVLRGAAWWELPYTEDRETLIQFGLEQGQLQLEVVDLHGQAHKPADQQFKMVIMPPQ